MQQIHDILTLEAPVGGKFLGLGYQQKPPFYSEDLLNVRAYDVLEGRGRMGSRPGLVKAFQTQLGSGNPIRLASVIRTFNAIGTTIFSDVFSGAAMSANWTAGAANNPLFIDTPTGTLPLVSGGGARLSTGGVPTELRLAVLTGYTDISTTASREVIVKVTQNGTPQANEKVALCLDLDYAIPGSLNMSSGIVLVVTRFPGAQYEEIQLLLYVGGTLVASPFLPSPQHSVIDNTTLRLSIDESKTIRYSAWSGQEFTYQSTFTPPATPRFGFALGKNGNAAADCDIESFVVNYISTSGGSPPEAAVFSSNAVFYRESASGVLTAVTGVALASDRRIFAASRLQKLYIADYGVRRERLASDAAATVANVSATQAILDDSAVADWSTLGIDTASDVLELLSATGVSAATTVLVGIYNIASVHATNGVTFDRNDAARIASACSYRIVRYPKVFDASAISLTRVGVGTLGTSQFPAGCRSLVLWQDRLVACNDPNTPHIWYMSRAGQPLVWDYGDTGTVDANGLTTGTLLAAVGVSAAVAGTQGEFSGLIGEPLITTIPMNDDILVFACRTSFYYLTGNPRLNGAMNNISREIGIVDIGAWCRTPDGRLIVLTPDGLYEINTEEAKPLSRDVIPQELLGLTDDLYEVTMVYDVLKRGIRISAAFKGSSTVPVVIPGVHYFYDLRTGGFFPELYEVTYEPTSVVSYQPGGVGIPVALWGASDGYVRRSEDGSATDDGTNFTSYVFYGPISLGTGAYGDGILHELVCVLDAQSGSVTVEVRTGYSPQAAKAATARYSTTMAAGRNRNRYPRLRGNCAYVVVSGTPGSRWAMESISVTREKTGRLSVI